MPTKSREDSLETQKNSAGHEVSEADPTAKHRIESTLILDVDESAIPNGGFQAWIQVVGGFLFYFNSWGLVNTFGTFETYYIQIFPKTPSEIAWIGTTQGFLLVLVGVLTGSLHDKGYFRPLVLVGSFMIVFGLMMLSLMTKYWQAFLAQAICIGLGSACVFLPSLSVVATYFSTKRGYAIGVVVSGGQLGGVIYPIMFRQLLPTLGFGWTTRVIGFMALGLLAISNAIMKPRVPPKSKGSLIDVAAFRDVRYSVFTLGLFFTFIGLYLPLYYTPTYGLIKLGMSLTEAFYLTAITNGASIAGAIVPSIIGDKLGPLNLMIPCSLITGILAFTWIGIHTIPGLQAFVAFYGFFTGCLITLPNPILISLSPSLQDVGSRVGMSYSIAAFGLLIGSPSGGALLDLEIGDFLKTQCFGGAFLFGGMSLFVLTRFLIHRQKKDRWASY
ncbi:MFS monocarboxylate transporter protein [Rutstroemia sp. NJR-2017a BBW]|nr:MFS monocarboxylate transporter protein [Rutstroemia sp. NJR-2017a BBW]